MNKSNVEYLQRSLKYLGFGTALNDKLEEQIREGKDRFQINTSTQFDNKHSLKDKEYPKDTINYELHFSKSKKSDNYFLNNYRASLEKGSPGQNEKAVSQTFSLNKGNDITAKEAYNLLSGRTIMKTVDIAKKLSLMKKDAEGNTVAEFKIKDLDDAKEKISSLVKNETEKQSGSYELQYQDQLIRVFNSDGKSKPLKGEGLELKHDFYNSANKKRHSESFPIKKLKDVKELIAKITKALAQENQTKDFSVLASNSALPLYKFDCECKELNIAPDSRKENIWIKMELQNTGPKGDYKFRRFYENYGFDLEKELDKISPVEMKDDQKKDRLLGSLQRGNLQLVNLERGESKESIYIAANPQFKKLDVYDKELKEIYQNRKEEMHNGNEGEVSSVRSR